MRSVSSKRAAGCSLVLFAAVAAVTAPAAALMTAAYPPPDMVTSVTALGNAEHGMLLAAKARINAKQAAATVKQKLGGKVLSVKLIESKGPPVYRIKTLSKSGVVKVVFVDGQSGKVFK